MDKVGKKGGRDLEVYIPRLMDDHNKISFWEESENLKKKNISKEYSHQAQQELQTNGKTKNDMLKFATRNDESKLDFMGRLSLPSKKNF